jgi:hypothetical protein
MHSISRHMYDLSPHTLQHLYLIGPLAIAIKPEAKSEFALPLHFLILQNITYENNA